MPLSKPIYKTMISKISPSNKNNSHELFSYMVFHRLAEARARQNQTAFGRFSPESD
jgi:hypothetical protein